MSQLGSKRSLLLVHAHPDDESIFTGATMAKYAAEGARVVLVTCTMGERGGIRKGHPAEAAAAVVRLSRDTESRLALMAKLRADELDAACAELGVTEHWYLGGPGKWHDSGRRSAADSRMFCESDLDEATGDLVAVIREVQPQAMVTYDANGLYEHPDHIQAHRVAWRAYQTACDPTRVKFYALTIPRSVLAQATSHVPWEPGPDERVRQPPPGEQRRPSSHGFLRYGVTDEEVTTQIDARTYLDAKLAALRAHATQIVVNGSSFAVVGLIKMRALGIEYYRLLSGPSGTATDSSGREDDLFCGL